MSLTTGLNEQDLKKNSSTASLRVMDEDDWRAQRCLSEDSVCEYAEALDSIRLFQLMHRDQYEPFAAVRHQSDGCTTIRVYFRKLYETTIPLNDDGKSGDIERPRLR